MSEMIERVAKAIANVDTVNYEGRYQRFARAAIKAMREPTEAMIESAGEEGAGWNDEARGYVIDRWRAMIDAAFDPPK